MDQTSQKSKQLQFYFSERSKRLAYRVQKRTSRCPIFELISSQLISHDSLTFFTATSGWGKLGMKNYSATNVVFPYIASLVDQMTECSDKKILTTVFTMNSDFAKYSEFNECSINDSTMSRCNFIETSL